MTVEERAEEYADRCACLMEDIPIIERAYKTGAEYGYNKAKEEDKELKEENAELKKELEVHDKWAENFKQKHYDEIALKDEEISCIQTDFNTFKSKAKDIIRNLLRVTYGEGWNYSLDWKVKAEDFLKEC